MVSYVYDSCGKLISIDGSMKDSVGVKNPYKYREYRYDSETELYYLNSRYYNPEFGRFINADGIIGQTGELLGHNLFIYSKNNPVNMSDSDGFRPEFSGTGHDTGDSSADSFAIMNKRYDYSTGYINKNFDYGDSINKGTKSGVIDKVGEVISGALMKDKIKWESLGTMTMGRYIGSIGKGAKIGKGTFGLAGTISFTFWDVRKDIAKGEYYSARADIIASGTALLLGIGIGAAVSYVALPAAGAFAGEIALSAIGGAVIDKIATYRKDVHYGS